MAPKISVTERNLPQRENVARVEFDCALEAMQCLFVFTLATLDGALQFEYPGIIGQALAGNFQFSQRAVIIEVSSIKILRAREVCFACIRAEAKCGLDGRFRQRQARRSMVVAKDVKEVMSPGQLAVFWL